jgi:hypothetical protein
VFLFCTLSARIFTAHPQAWADFLKAEKLTEDLLLKSYQIIHRVSAAPTFRKGLYCGGAEAGLIQGLDLLENYITSRLSSVQFATSVVKVTCHNHTPYDLTAYFADTSLPCLLVPLPQRLARPPSILVLFRCRLRRVLFVSSSRSKMLWLPLSSTATRILCAVRLLRVYRLP